VWVKIHMEPTSSVVVMSDGLYDPEEYIADFDEFIMSNADRIAKIGVFRLEPSEYAGSFSSSTWLDNEENRFNNYNKEQAASEHSDLLKFLNDEDFRDASIIDFGGSLGFGYLAIMNGVEFENVEYTVVDTSEVCEAGRQLFATNRRVRFVDEIDDRSYNIAYIRTALQYADDWRKTIDDLVKTGSDFFIFSYLFAGKFESFKATQMYYGDKIPYWFIGIDELKDLMKAYGYDCCVDEEDVKIPQYLYHADFDEALRIASSRAMIFARLS